MAEYVSAVHGSLHRKQNCLDCHEASLATKLRHIRVHLTGNLPEEIRLRDVDVLEMTPNCQRCHQHEYASWQAGPHSATYSADLYRSRAQLESRTDERLLALPRHDFSGSIRDLVQPQNTQGAHGMWFTPDLPISPPCPAMRATGFMRKARWRQSRRRASPSRPRPFTIRWPSMTGAKACTLPPSCPSAIARRRSRGQIEPGPAPGDLLPVPRAREAGDGSTAAAMGWGPQVGSGDDRTPMGVHEGISCIACHDGHNENTRASCKTCHPQMSHCGLDVEKMDTTYRQSLQHPQHSLGEMR